MRVSPARQTAFEVLWRVGQEAAFASHLLASPRYDYLSPEDRALAQELTLGVLRWQRRLDFLIEHFTGRPLGKLDPQVVIALRLGLYQLHFLSRVPAHAAINEAVNLVKEHRKQSAASLVNAALRAAQRAGSLEAVTASIPNPLDRLGVETSHPAWLLRRWIERFGLDETRALALANNETPRTSFRFNPRRAGEAQTRQWLAEHGVTIRDSALAPRAAFIEGGSLSAQAEPVRDGWLYLQDEASQLVAHLAAHQLQTDVSNPKFLDLCAAPGGKSTLLAELLPNDSLVVGCDLRLPRLRTTQTLAARLGVSLNLFQLDASQPLPFGDATFDGVLLDAPCSGLGTLPRHPEIKWRTDVGKLRKLAALQWELLGNAAARVRPGGLLTYSVCSTEVEEGEELMAELKAARPEFRDVTRERLAELGLAPEGLLTGRHGARTFPHRQGTEGFFVCILWKRR